MSCLIDSAKSGNIEEFYGVYSKSENASKILQSLDSNGSSILHHIALSTIDIEDLSNWMEIAEFIAKELKEDKDFDFTCFINKTDKKGKTPIDLAITSQKPDFVYFLIGNGAILSFSTMTIAKEKKTQNKTAAIIENAEEFFGFNLPTKFTHQK